MRSTIEIRSKDQCVPPSAWVTLRQSFIGRKTWETPAKLGRASLRVCGFGVWRIMNDMLGRRRTMLEDFCFARTSCSRYLDLIMSAWARGRLVGLVGRDLLFPK